MSFEAKLKKICKLNEGALYKHSSLYVLKYELKIVYRKCPINITYIFGNSNTANFKIHLSGFTNIPKFKITTIDHFTKLILFKKQNWKIECKNMSFKQKIENLLKQSRFIKLTKKTAFEPTTIGKNGIKEYTIHTFFSLNYKGKTKSINCILDFHKNIIDLIKQ